MLVYSDISRTDGWKEEAASALLVCNNLGYSSEVGGLAA
jgi:hypothetical protein